MSEVNSKKTKSSKSSFQSVLAEMREASSESFRPSVCMNIPSETSDLVDLYKELVRVNEDVTRLACEQNPSDQKGIELILAQMVVSIEDIEKELVMRGALPSKNLREVLQQIDRANQERS